MRQVGEIDFCGFQRDVRMENPTATLFIPEASILISFNLKPFP
jgi:hypothetical protein